ncbi:MAG: AAA family ATPase, partial [Planctomycetaceae bacterium]|nr:AAA family ATPase [Planctomycetaceae bacterium]
MEVRSPQETAELVKILHENISSVLIGKPEVVQLAIVTLLAEGHILIEDAPGVGKTSLAKAIAKSLDCNYKR